MKKIITLSIFVLMNGIVNPAFSLGGIGMYGLSDAITVGAGTDGTFPVQLERDGFDGAIGGGLFLYVDAIPFIDLEANIETAFNEYSFQFKNALSDLPPVDFGWARISIYLTVRRKLFGLSIPLLGGVKLHAGGGYNMHSSTPLADLDMVKTLLGGDLSASFVDSDLESKLIEFLKDNKIDANGFHFQVGTQFKLLALNLFLNYRVTIAEDVVPGEKSFSSLWLGLAFGI